MIFRVGYIYVINVFVTGWKKSEKAEDFYKRNKKGFGFRIVKLK
jgi:hypothetical protein